MDVVVADLVRLVETPKESAADALAGLGGIEGVADKLRVQLETGLSDADQGKDIAERKARFGTNYVEPEKPSSILELMWEAWQDLTIMILTGSGAASLILGLTIGHDTSVDWIEGASILFAVLIVVFVTAINDYQKEKQFQALNAVKEDEKIKVIRNGVPAEVSKFSLVVGDIVRVDLGDIIPADGLVFDENDLKLDESAMTGESVLLKKDRKLAPFLLSGTKVMEGVGKMLVICVGENSQAGIISKLIRNASGKHAEDKKVATKTSKQDTPTPVDDPVDPNYIALATPRGPSTCATEPDVEEIVSPLQGKLDRLTILIGKLGLAMAVIVFVAMSIRFSVKTFAIDKKEWTKSFAEEYLNFLIVAITVLVVAIPEGLPLAVTIALAFSVKKMLKDNNLVRHLDACETMGSATTICSDKTGTLTTNRMTVMECYLGQHEFSSAPSLRLQASAATKDILCSSISINSTAEILPPKQVGAQPEHTGNKTECALLQFAADLGVSYADVRKAASICHMLTFSSAKKRMSVVVPLSATRCRIFTKGASEIVLELCTSQLHLDGSTAAFSAAERNAVNANIIDKYASQAYRTLCLAFRDVDASPDQVKTWPDEDVERDLTYICIVGIEDPVREEVPESIRQCNEAGIVVRMVTGDNIATARSIALKCGIIRPNDGSLVMEGSVFRARVLDANGNIKQDEFDKIWPMLRVLARSSPKDKYTLVSGLIQSNVYPHGPQVVAVTGDGTNDAPALKKADVGFAMGICGTAVAKDASDIILMDDNFRSIVSAVKWGRNVYDSIAKFLQFQLTVNIVAITTAVVGAIALNESPLTAIQLLWVNLIMDTFASLALATDPPTDSLLHRKPYPRTKALLSKKMLKHILGQSVFQLVLILLLVFQGDAFFGIKSGRRSAQQVDSGERSPPSQHYTIVFNTFVFLQLFNELNSRKIHDEVNIFTNIWGNTLFIGISIFQVGAQALICQLGGRAFGCAMLTTEQFFICVGLGSLSLPVGLLLRLTAYKPLNSAFKGKANEAQDTSTRGRELWMRGLRRLRAQVRVVKAFQRGLGQDIRRPLQ
ncbi:calcium-translocating P-type ATPase, PMCA-type, variant [Aphanomyces invadans]|uniref:Calcium-transporting ATPase n=1 Tax=Aphanomyces invadans TaxID=157072 RepID=A0A024UQ96_9STRA|nr:calcium-translocating P-type ATPase, PMCA-type [Aphanomyces invadans]XP_008863912.1 calcium-translocating P-type ATPase, PMCA-type, variant [Aphanomyces invadans]ETW07818.1 calcium-translocating P-type ATPase, PMCA-type [Aphanomyces invadans]ETW07819.1 calcium-translocating P-type ATPase, PMCA-type, variant [Aphanomyces invadans]|eukprot:XP_008863911.1 calcium-translocating P-type ATPase, PMCA-type [Aphanomyces invadans]